MLKLYYVANARMPNEKAHGIQIARMCEAFLACGVDLTLIVPGRSQSTQTLQKFYGLSHEVPVVKIPTLRLYTAGRIGFATSSFFFMGATQIYLWYKKVRGEKFTIYTVDMDNFSYVLLPFAGKTFTEMHTPKDISWLQRFFFKRVGGVIATNGLIRQRLIDDYSIPEVKIIAEPNGVNVKQFMLSVYRAEAREKLLLPQDKKIVLYIGRFYKWKGLDILPAACEKLLGDTICYVVGGTKAEFLKIVGKATLPENMFFAGERPASEIPLWLQAADALLQLGTAKNEDSNKYTSPMKMFEYMASGVPIVASATPAVKDVLSREEAFFYEPDDAESLRIAIQQALKSEDALVRAGRAQVKAKSLSWDNRAKKILAFIGAADTLK